MAYIDKTYFNTIEQYKEIYDWCHSQGIVTDDYEEGGKYYNCHMQRFKIFLNYFKRSIIVTLVLTVINIFIPTKNEALLIYGVGGTIDYIKSNDTAKQLPDKCIKALDKWVENLNEEKKQDKKEE